MQDDFHIEMWEATASKACSEALQRKVHTAETEDLQLGSSDQEPASSEQEVVTHLGGVRKTMSDKESAGVVLNKDQRIAGVVISQIEIITWSLFDNPRMCYVH